MAEIACDCRVTLVHMVCDKCKEGTMIPTGEVLMSNPVQCPHRCENCGNIQNYNVSYPYQKLVPIKPLRKLRKDETDNVDI